MNPAARHPLLLLFVGFIALHSMAPANANDSSKGCTGDIPVANTDINASPAALPDFKRINSALLETDDKKRVADLQQLIDELRQQRNAMAQEITARLQVALAHTHVRLGDNRAALLTLRQVSLDSSRAEEALFMTAEIEAQQGHMHDATQWMLRMARYFPENPLSVRALLKAANWQTDEALTLALLQEARDSAARSLEEVTRWQTAIGTPEFFSSDALEHPTPLLYQLIRKALLDAHFKEARYRQKEALNELGCLNRYLEGQQKVLETQPKLIADLTASTQAMNVQLEIAREALPRQETAFLATAAELKTCRNAKGQCNTLQTRYEQEGKALTGWRNRLHVLEQKNRFLHSQRTTLQNNLLSSNRQALALTRLVVANKTEASQILKPLLEAAINESVSEWKDVTALAYHQLGVEHEIRSDTPIP